MKGWGHYVVIEHQDGSKSLYAHLEQGQVRVTAGQAVSAGDTIALSDNSGGSQAPHLHVEYAPNGKIFDKSSKVDPNACIGNQVAGAISVRDNGKVICTTMTGGANNCSLGALRPGTASLAITATVAPENVGTYEIVLSARVTFLDGTTLVSSSLSEGASATFGLIIAGSSTGSSVSGSTQQ